MGLMTTTTTVLQYETPRRMERAARLWKAWVYVLGPLLGLILVYGLFAALGPPSFSAPSNVVTILRQTAIVGTAALGMTLVITAGGIDLSVGSMIALVTVATGMLLRAGHGPVVAALGGIGIGAAAGLFNGVLVSALSVGPFIVTLGTLLVLRGAAKGLAHNQTVLAPPTWLNDLLGFVSLDISPRWVVVPAVIGSYAGYAIIVVLILFAVRDAARGRYLSAFGFVVGAVFAWLFRAWLNLLLPPGVWLMFLLALLVAGLMRYTRLGRHVFAIGSNEPTARLCGVNVPRVKLSVYALGGLFAGIAGLMQFSRLAVGDPTVAVGLELDVIAAVVIGGASLSGGQGSILGSLVGALIMTVIRNGCDQMYIEDWVQEILTGAIIVLAVALDRLRQQRTA
jgi:ribose/xylose/arabinose/galactoside ABC-type transport system permease subunit